MREITDAAISESIYPRSPRESPVSGDTFVLRRFSQEPRGGGRGVARSLVISGFSAVLGRLSKDRFRRRLIYPFSSEI